VNEGFRAANSLLGEGEVEDSAFPGVGWDAGRVPGVDGIDVAGPDFIILGLLYISTGAEDGLVG
jgi:hypothetical protein